VFNHLSSASSESEGLWEGFSDSIFRISSWASSDKLVT
ncbi:unnamed protein product, partial [Oikopleura dioica]